MPPDWELWLDCQFSPVIAKWIHDKRGWAVRSAYTLNLFNLTDLQIYEMAKARGNVILISKDADFRTLIMQRGAPPKLITVRHENCPNRTMFDHLNNGLDKAVRLLFSFNIDILDLE